MITRLSPRDAEFFRLESSSNPVHIGSLAIVRATPPEESPAPAAPETAPADAAAPGLDYQRLLGLVDSRLPLVPRYRRKVREIPLRVGRPIWVEDSRFDLTYHVRRSALPAPGTADQLYELVGRLASRPLDPARPLWEMYLIEGLTDGRSAIFTKTHSALVDGESALEIGHVILDTGPAPRELAPDTWVAHQEPGNLELLGMAVAEVVSQPAAAWEVLRDVGTTTSAVAQAARSATESVLARVRAAGRTAPDSIFNTAISRSRRFDIAATDLADYRRIRKRFDCSINDAILAVVTGALRIFQQSRGEVLTQSAVLRAVVPMSVYVEDGGLDTVPPAAEVSSFLIDLPVGESNPVMRLSHISHATAENARHRRGVKARTLIHMAGFAPASLHAMSVRAASTFAEHTFNLVITNAPGPQQPMYVGGARMLEMYPVSPLLRHQASSIGITSYDGRVFYGLNADREAMADIAVLAAAVPESMEEMLGACV
ncbi:MAG: wax ester/triacylglycerol synthase family O-acyltransferase [Nocardia sp.]|nr:wax ester/triacylglycerol synthase family O-acyltransferase [Nocardia sp.]